MKSKEEILNFFDNEAALGFCTNEYALRLKWYFATYYNEYAQQSQPSGMRWVKASERLPDNPGLFHFKSGYLHDVVFYDKKNGFYKPKVKRTTVKDTIRTKLETEIAPMKYPLDQIEWLDESSPAGAAEWVKRYKTVVNDTGFDKSSEHYVNNVFMRNANVWSDEHDWMMTKDRFVDVVSLFFTTTQPSSAGMAEAVKFAKFLADNDYHPGSGNKHWFKWNGMEVDETPLTLEQVYKIFASLSPGVEDGSGWVKVETPPNDGVYVLLHGKGGRNFTALYKQGQFLAYNPFNEELDLCEEVTHWRPLPTPPGVEDNQTKKQ